MDKIKSLVMFAGKVWVALAVLSVLAVVVSKVSPELGGWVLMPSRIGDKLAGQA